MEANELRLEPEKKEQPAREKRLRGTFSPIAYIAVALLLVAGVVMPLLDGAELGRYRPDFINLRLLDDESAPLLMKVLLVYPAAAAVAVIIAAACAQGIMRAFLVHLLAVFPFIVYYADETVRRGLGSPLELPEQFNPFLPFGGAFALAAVVALYAGNRVRRFHPESRAAAIAGGFGGIYYFFSLIVPIESGASGAYPVFSPFKMMFEEKGLWAWQVIGFSRLLTMLLLTAASIIAVHNITDRPGAALRARLSGRMWWWHLMLLLAAPCAVLLILQFRAATPPGVVLTGAVLTVKTALTTLGFFFLALMSAADLIAGGEPAPRDGGEQAGE